MARVTNATPLIALDAIVLDTETTGLDPAKARIVEIGAVPLRRGRLDETAALRRLVNPGEAIAADATRIHAIDDSMVASAPKFAAVWPDVSRRDLRRSTGSDTLSGSILPCSSVNASAPPWPGFRRARLIPGFCAGSRTQSWGLHAGAAGELAWCRHRKSPLRARRRRYYG